MGRKRKYDFKTVLKLRNEGKTYKEIGEMLGLAESSVSSQFSVDMKEAGMSLGEKQKENQKYDYETVRKYRQEGLTYKEISEIVGVPGTTLAAYYNRDLKAVEEGHIQEILEFDFAAVPYEPNEFEIEIRRLREENEMLRKLLKSAL